MEPEYILLYKETRSSSCGAISYQTTSLVPPPIGERFEGGHHIERNPITGGHRLHFPEEGKTVLCSAKFVISVADISECTGPVLIGCQHRRTNEAAKTHQDDLKKRVKKIQVAAELGQAQRLLNLKAAKY